MLLHVSLVYSFLFLNSVLNSVPFYTYAAVYPFLSCETFELFPVWGIMSKVAIKIHLQFLSECLGKYLGVKLLECVCLTS